MFIVKLFAALASTLTIAAPLSSSSSVVKCHITSDTSATAAAENDYLRVGYHPSPDARNGDIDSVSYVSVISATGEEVVSPLHSQAIRGGYDIVGTCNPDEHYYSPASQTFALYSNCVSGQKRVRVNGELGKAIAGSLKIKFFAADGSLTTREIATEACE